MTESGMRKGGEELELTYLGDGSHLGCEVGG